MMLAGKQKITSENGYPSTRDRLIIEHIPYVKHIVHRIAIHLPSSVEIEDLINVGIIGLIEAADRYDPARDNKFATYAAFRIRGAVLSELRSRDFLSRGNRRRAREVETAYLKLEQRLGTEVGDDEVANELGVSVGELNQLKKLSRMSFISLEEIGFLSKNEKKKLMSCLIDSDDEDPLGVAGLKEIRRAMAQAIEKLSEKERLVVSLYYWEELTMKEIGAVLEITESRVSQIHSQAIGRLRKKLIKENLLQ